MTIHIYIILKRFEYQILEENYHQTQAPRFPIQMQLVGRVWHARSLCILLTSESLFHIAQRVLYCHGDVQEECLSLWTMRMRASGCHFHQ